ncbi:Mediator of RNA polymerase II transcription subunit 23 [Hypsibius exemplaris]|uniref:Mediator of RNA polymerase II transcription subunit 23 n=1 Tax=Hypsibius exemplaris TaxID=2072580 RepID=A0A9X6NFS0_HYPEX|nr:Mediator of RNA polymerase II transcription subunit 23 [Hypsibius exemplaris]
MAALEPLTEQSVQFMIKSLDRFDSFALMFHDTIIESQNDPLVELCQRLPTLFGRSTSLETQERAIQLLVSYILNPLNSRKVTHRLFHGLLEALRAPECLASGMAVRLVLLALLRMDGAPAKLKGLSAGEFIKPVIGLLDVANTKDILQEVVGKVLAFAKIGKRKHRDDDVVVDQDEMRAFFHAMIDSRPSLVPLVVILKEFVRLLPDKMYYENFTRPFAKFGNQARNVLNVLSIQHQEEYFPVIGYTLVASPSLWSLDKKSLQFLSPLGLSFAAVSEPPLDMIQYLIEQAHSRHTYQAILDITKGQFNNASGGLEDQLVAVMMLHITGSDEAALFPHWVRISSQFVTMGLSLFVSFRSVIEKICSALDKIPIENLAVGRNYLMWCVYQFIAVLPAGRTADFMVCRELFEKLYYDPEPIPIPDFSSSFDIAKLGPAYLWVYMMRRAKQDNVGVACNTPTCLKLLIEYILAAIDRAVSQPGFQSMHLKPEHAAVVNCFVSMPVLKDQVVASKMDYVDKMAYSLIDYTLDNSGGAYSSSQSVGSTLAPGGCSVYNVTKPLQMDWLDGVSIHIRTILANMLSSCFSRVITSFRDVPGSVFLAPAFWETVSRLMLYEESLNVILTLIGMKLPEMAKNNALFLLATNFELLAFRMPYLPINWKGNIVVMAMNMHKEFNNFQPTGSIQALVYMYQVIMRSIQSFNVEDFSTRNSHLSVPALYLPESEEITRLLLLTIFRLTSIVGLDQPMLQFLNNHLASVQEGLPHTWGHQILSTLPENVRTFYGMVPPPAKFDKKSISGLVEEFVRRLRAANTDQEVRRVFETLNGKPVLIYCVIWRQLVLNSESGDLAAANAVPFKGPHYTAVILEKQPLKMQMTALRFLMDYVIADIRQMVTVEQISRQCECLSLMVWKYHILPFDRVLLVTLLRHFGDDNSLVSVLCVHLFCKAPEFLARLAETVNLIPPVYWQAENYFDQVVAYHHKYPEYFQFNGNFDMNNPVAGTPSLLQTRYPLYFSNVILRCVPVFDVMVHRFIELPGCQQQFETVLELCGKIFSFHDRPVTFLWQTFHFYDNLLKDNLAIRRKLMKAVVGFKAEHYPPNFYFTAQYEAYLTATTPDATPSMPIDYFHHLLARLHTCMYSSHNSPPVYHTLDWRFHEYPNATTHALYTGCLELMSIPGGADGTVSGLVGCLSERMTAAAGHGEELAEREKFQQLQRWINSAGLFLSALPARYFRVLLNMLDVALWTPEMSEECDTDIVTILDLQRSLVSQSNSSIAFTCQLIQATILQNTVAHMLLLLGHFHQIIGSVSTLSQILLLLKLITPLLGKLTSDLDRLRAFVTDVLQAVTRVATRQPASTGSDQQIALLSEALFYILDTYPVDQNKELTSPFINGLPDGFHKRLRFLAQANGFKF